MLVAAGMAAGLAACDDKIEPFETEGFTGTPVAFDASTVSSEALPGEIKLSWTEPAEDFSYMQIRYFDPLSKEDVCRLVSKGDYGAAGGEYTGTFR